MKTVYLKRPLVFVVAVLTLIACKKEHHQPVGKDPNTAAEVSVDRFSSTAGHLQVRTATNGLPQPNAPVNFDQEPFITKGLGPNGEKIQYYNFDVQSTAPAPIYVLFKGGQQVSGQLNIVDVVPGTSNYNDFWQMYKVNVPDNYVANSVTSYQELVSAGYSMEKTNVILNCPIVPKGSTASKRLNGGDAGLSRGWYKGSIVYYFNFSEKALVTNGSGMVPAPPIYVTFSINPNQPDGGPASGFKAESPTTGQTHNVASVLPANTTYSPLWLVKVYDNSAFSMVSNITSAAAAPILDPAAGTVNCPIVSVQ